MLKQWLNNIVETMLNNIVETMLNNIVKTMLNNTVETMLNNIVDPKMLLTHDNNVDVQPLFKQRPCNREQPCNNPVRFQRVLATAVFQSKFTEFRRS